MGKTKTTESSRRHAFASFRERVDRIKIEPNLKLTKRAHDYVETSYFLTTLEHWREINISGNFTEFLDKVEPISQSLAQILHHQKKIYAALQEHILRNDPHSNQPLMEMMAQFVHDLGPDFMVFYESFLDMMATVAIQTNPNDKQNARNASSTLEWVFNCLAFAFKYLAKELVKDLLPTFRAMMPLLQMQKRTYLSRFCSEALSFLIRKSDVQMLGSVLEYSFDEQAEVIETNETYRESLTVLYAEAMKNTKGSFHSKASGILAKMVENALDVRNENNHSDFISVTTDVLLELIAHGTPENCAKFYSLVTDYLESKISSSVPVLMAITQILTTLAFAESGTKVPNWAALINVGLKVKEAAVDDVALSENIHMMLVTIFRNCETQTLMKSHKALLDEELFRLVEACCTTTNTKITTFGGKYIQDKINRAETTAQRKEVALFVSNMAKNNYYNMPPPTVPAHIQNTCIEEIKDISNKKILDLFEVYWRMLLVDSESTFLIPLLSTLLKQPDSKFRVEVISTVVGVLGKVGTDCKEIFSSLVGQFDRLAQSASFTEAFRILITKCNVKEMVGEVRDQLLEQLVHNLHMPSHEARANAIELIYIIHELTNTPFSTFLSQIRVLEQIPLALENGRDITLRVRKLGTEFRATKPDPFSRRAVVYYMFGMLTNRFQPCWAAVFDVLPMLNNTGDLVWEMAYYFMREEHKEIDNKEEIESEKYEMEIEEEKSPFSSLEGWISRDSRVRGFFNTLEDVFSKYRNIDSSIQELSHGVNSEYPEMMRQQAVTALSKVPYAAESHSAELVPFLLNHTDSWPLKVRNELVEVFGKFKHLQKVHDAEGFYEYVLDLLCHTQVSVQRMALQVVLNWGNEAIAKYRDNLTNLLDETIFRDELAKFVRSDVESEIEEEDLPDLMPIVLRILYGRVQGASKSNNKGGKKFAVVSVLPNLGSDDVSEFLRLGYGKISYEKFWETEEIDVSHGQLRKISGFVALLEEVYSTLGKKYAEPLGNTIPPLVYGLVVAQAKIDAGDEDNDDKTARTIRQNGMKCLNRLFEVLGDYVWDKHMPTVYKYVVAPRLPKFAAENLQQPSSLMKMMVGWIEHEHTAKFLCMDDYAPASALVSLLQMSPKDSVVHLILEFAKSTIKKGEPYLVAIIVDSLLCNLSTIIDNISDKDIGHVAVEVLHLLVDGKYIDEASTQKALLSSLTSALQNRSIDPIDKAGILSSLAALVEAYECEFSDIESLYRTCSEAFRVYADSRVRTTLVGVFEAIGQKFEDYQLTAELVADLNSYNPKRMREYDFGRRLAAFKRINEELYMVLTPEQWLPIIYSALFFINDPSELAIRTNASYLLRRFIDGVKDDGPALSMFRQIVLPNLRGGLKKLNEEIQTEYIEVLEHLVCSAHFEDLGDMRVLTLGNDDDENVGNFFANINHIQLVRRQRAVRNLVEVRHHLRPSSIAHYILPIIEHYAVSKEEKFNNVGDQTLDTISYLMRCVTWYDYKATLKRHMANLRGKDVKKTVNMIVALSKAFMESKRERDNKENTNTMESRENEETKENTDTMETENTDTMETENSDTIDAPLYSSDIIVDLPDQSSLDSFILQEIFPPLLKVLNVRDDDTIVARAPLSEALCCFITGISPGRIETELPAVLTNTCQVMRSRSEELRDAVRKSLCRILAVLGPKYLRFVLGELKSALSRGSQIHVLSFTAHYVVQYMADKLKHGDLDDALPVLVDIMMEDIFGAAGQEKDAEGYHSKMKEVKFKKSFDTGEFATANIHLSSFSLLLAPIRAMLNENMSLKTQTKLDELMRRFALGLNHNEEAASPDILVLCYEIYKSAFVTKDERPEKELSEAEKHFLVHAPKSKRVANAQLHQEVMQRFALDLLRTALARHADLVTVANVAGFLPLLQESLESTNEGVVAAALKILNAVARLPFSPQQDQIFFECTKKSLEIVQESPSTHSDICQASLKFLATIIRHRSEIEVPNEAIAYVLQRLLPDLEEPQRQSLAFGFVKAVVARHIVLSDVYDVMHKVSHIMVTNGSKEIRDMSRSVFFQFLMEYEHGRSKLDAHFKFLVSNLAYPAENGRQSVMELIHLVVAKCSPQLLSQLASSFFVALANVLTADDSPRCREMAASLLGSIIRSVDSEALEPIHKFTSAWIRSGSPALKRCGLSVYKIYVTERGYGNKLDAEAIANVASVVHNAKKSDTSDLEWDLLYAALNVFVTLARVIKNDVFASRFAPLWHDTIDCLLYPHAWVRLSSSRLMGLLLANFDEIEFEVSEYELQTIAYRLLRQLNAPSISETLGNQIVKNLVSIAMRWEKKSQKYIQPEMNENEDEKNENEDEEKENEDEKNEENKNDEDSSFVFSNDFLVHRTCATIRAEHNYKYSYVSKKSAIKLAAMLIQVTSSDRAVYVAEKVLLAMYNITEQNDAQNSKEEEDLVNMTLECKQMLEKKLGVTDYTHVYAKVTEAVESRRHERKVKRAQMAITNPDIVAKRKLRKHERTKEKRKHEKDENGYYRSKRRKFEKVRR